jgi:hypothetical protein
MNMQPMQPMPLVMKQSNHNFERRDANYIRPHSHNPFLTQNNQNPGSSQKILEDRGENRKSRSISASANIKISFMSK